MQYVVTLLNQSIELTKFIWNTHAVFGMMCLFDKAIDNISYMVGYTMDLSVKILSIIEFRKDFLNQIRLNFRLCGDYKMKDKNHFDH